MYFFFGRYCFFVRPSFLFTKFSITFCYVCIQGSIYAVLKKGKGSLMSFTEQRSGWKRGSRGKWRKERGSLTQNSYRQIRQENYPQGKGKSKNLAVLDNKKPLPLEHSSQVNSISQEVLQGKYLSIFLILREASVL